MKINNRIQDKFSAEKCSLWIEFPDGSKRETDFKEIELVLKDIRFIRHELTNYSYLYASQLSFDGHLNKNYWEFLKLKGEIGQNDRNELEEGALLVIYLFYTEIFEDEGLCFLQNLFGTVNNFIEDYTPDNEKKMRIIDCIKFLKNQYENKLIGPPYGGKFKRESQKFRAGLIENNKWVHKTFVEEYFLNKANSFEPLRKQTKNFFDSIRKKGN